MKKFKFRLQTLLDQRKAKEEQIQIEFGELKKKEALEKEKLEKLMLRLEETLLIIEKALNDGEDTAEIQRMFEFANATREDIRIQDLILERIKIDVAKKREELVEAMKDRKVLDTLKEKQEEEYLKECMRLEQNELDEVASVRYARGG
ncbi:MAG: flagellar export protein FliJ [Armatimonadota bacterium]